MPSSHQQQETPAALEGVIVAELGARIGASVCASLLAQLGAKVIAIEAPSDRPDFDKSGHRSQLCAGKLSFAPDLNSEADRALLRDILSRSDIVLTSSDIDRTEVQKQLPARPARQIVCDITAFGDSGTFSGSACSDTEVQALVGIMHTTGNHDGPPTPIALPVVEYLTGMHAAGAILCGLHAVQQNQPGQHIDMALYDTGFAAMSSFLARSFASKEPVPTERIGNRHSLSAPWNVYRASDGWVQICTGSDLQWRRLCALMGCLELADDARYESSAGRVANVEEVDAIVQGWMQKHSVTQCVDALSAANIPGGQIAVIDGHPREANLAHRNMIIDSLPEHESTGPVFYLPGSPLKMSISPGLALRWVPALDADRISIKALVAQLPAVLSTPSASPAPPLAGVRVIEIGHYTTAPVAARYLASLGADVVKIEPPEGEASREWPPLRNGQSLFYTLSNSDKRCITLDLTTVEGQGCLRSLLETADVLIENLKPGTLTKRGFSADQIAQINPRLIYCAISGFGSDSLYSGRPAFDTVVQAMSGLMDLIKTGDTPLKTGISIADLMGASMSVVAVLAALVFRKRAAQGQSIDLSMQDILSWSTQIAWNDRTTNNSQWMVVRRTEGYALTRGGRTVEIKTPAEALLAEQTMARQLWFELSDIRGTWPTLATPLRLLGTPCMVKGVAPQLGAHNPEIIDAGIDRSDRTLKKASRAQLA